MYRKLRLNYICNGFGSGYRQINATMTEVTFSRPGQCHTIILQSHQRQNHGYFGRKIVHGCLVFLYQRCSEMASTVTVSFHCKWDVINIVFSHKQAYTYNLKKLVLTTMLEAQRNLRTKVLVTGTRNTGAKPFSSCTGAQRSI